MFRVCLTLLAYIISFLSHSNEMKENPDREIEHLSSNTPALYKVPDTLAVQERKKNVNLKFKVKTNKE